MATKAIPHYIDPAGDPGVGALPVRPPFLFREVTARVFPLKANIARLTQFCDSYLNMDIPQEIVHYRPALPYVYMMILNYGSMSPSSIRAQNVGWVAQHEVTFTVPLQRWRKENGTLVFKDWANVSPFIFVDDEVSQTTGREVYGWPKILARVDADTPLWAAHPWAAIRLFSLSTHMFEQVYAGQQEVMRVLLRVERDASPMLSQLPPDPDNPAFPLSFIPAAIRNSLSLMGDTADLLLGMRLRGFSTDRGLDALMSMAGKGVVYLGRMLSGLPFTDLVLGSSGDRDRDHAEAALRLPGLFMDSVTLKQFRDPEDPKLARYVALVNSGMGIDRLNRCGLLGDVEVLRGDPSGGYSVRIHQYTSQPIIHSLGLEVLSRYQESDGQWVSVLKPSFPFWTDVDLYYGAGAVICARTNRGGSQKAYWEDHQKDRLQSAALSGQGPTRAPSEILYNTALGAATAPVLGPFHFPDMTVQVYPLLADCAQLTWFVDNYLNGPFASTDLRFKTAGSYVYLVVSVFGNQLGTMWSSSNNIGWWAEREVAFCVPVKWYRGGRLVSLAMIEPFVYASNGRAVITDREVNGRPSVSARIESPKDVWLTRSGPANDRKMLHMETEIFPALNLGQRAQQRTLLDIDGEDVLPYNDDVGWRKVAETWGRDLVDEIRRMRYLRSVQATEVRDAQSLALEVLAHEAPLNRIVLKQYREAADVELACYQAAVHTSRSITAIYDVREIENRVHLRLHRVPGHPIAAVLGLKVKSTDSSGGNVIDNIQPLRPFWMRISMKEELGTVIGTVTGTRPAGPQPGGSPIREWLITHPWFGGPAASGTGPIRPAQSSPYFPTPGGTRVGTSLNLHPQNLKEQAARWLREVLAKEMGWLKVSVRGLGADALRALHAKLSRRDSDDLRQFEDSSAIAGLCQGLAAERLIALDTAVQRAGLIVPKLTDMPEATPEENLQPAADSKLAADLAAAANLMEGLRQVAARLPQNAGAQLAYVGDLLRRLPDRRRAACLIMLPQETRASLDALARLTPDQAGPDEEMVNSLRAAIESATEEWCQPSRWRRLTAQEATTAIDTLDEIQLVLDSILSDEWENWGDPRFYKGEQKKLEEEFPRGSIGTDVAKELLRGYAGDLPIT
jgi:hypothetical protein